MGKRRNSGTRKPKARERGSGENTNSTLDVSSVSIAKQAGAAAVYFSVLPTRSP